MRYNGNHLNHVGTSLIMFYNILKQNTFLPSEHVYFRVSLPDITISTANQIKLHVQNYSVIQTPANIPSQCHHQDHETLCLNASQQNLLNYHYKTITMDFIVTSICACSSFLKFSQNDKK